MIRLLQTAPQQGRVHGRDLRRADRAAKAGLHAGQRVTSYPGSARTSAAATYVEDRVVVDGKVVTSRGPGTALEFALTLVRLLKDDAAAKELKRPRCWRRICVVRGANASSRTSGAFQHEALEARLRVGKLIYGVGRGPSPDPLTDGTPAETSLLTLVTRPAP